MQAHERYQRARDLFFSALDCPPAERSRFLAEACGGDLSLLRQTVQLLEVDQSPDGWFSRIESQVGKDVVPALADAERSGPTRQVRPQPVPAGLPSPRLADLMGQVLDRKYRIDKQLGTGGMGAVYQATHLHTKRPVAVKVISPEFSHHPEFVERFRREAEAAGRLRHPNVVNTTDFGFAELDGQKLAYLVMEYLDGETLKRLLRRRGRLPLGLVVDLIEQVALAVGKAHAQGIVHRDLKPDNIWLEPTGRGGFNVKVLDFGIAKLRSEPPPTGSPQPLLAALPTEPGTAPSLPVKLNGLAAIQGKGVTALQEKGNTGGNRLEVTEGAGLTQVGTVMGTPQYMSPEQCGGQPVDSRSDIYSLGIITYEMLAGRPPFTGDLLQLTAHHKESAPPSLGEKCPDLPPEVIALVAEALAKDPAGRPATAEIFAAGLRVQAGSLAQLEKEASLLWQSHRAAFPRVLQLAHFPFTLGATAAIVFLIRDWQVSQPIATLLWLAVWLLPLLLLGLGAAAGRAMSAKFIQQIQAAAVNQEGILPLGWSFPKSLPRIALQSLRATGLGLLKGRARLSDGLLTAPVALVENRPVPDAFGRSEALLHRFRPFAHQLTGKLFRHLLGVLLLVFPFFTLLGQSLSGIDFIEPPVAVAIEFVLVFLALFGLTRWLFLPLEAAGALLYFKARQVSEQAEPGFSLADLTGMSTSEPVKPFRWRGVVVAGTTAIMLVLLLLVQLLFIPPMEPLPQPRPMAMPKVPKEENAWVEYRVAIRKLGTTLAELQDFPVELAKYGAWEKDRLSATEELFLNDNQEALRHLLAGAKRPFAQFSDQPYSSNSEMPSLPGTRNLTRLAVVEARRLFEQGNHREAVELALAAYRLGCDMAEPQAPLLPALFAISVQGVVEQFLFGLLSEKEVEPELAQKIAVQMHHSNARVGTPVQVLEAEAFYGDTYLAGTLIRTGTMPAFGKKPDLSTPTSGGRLFPGLWTRLYRSTVESRHRFFDQLRPGLATWNNEAVNQVESRYPLGDGWWPSPLLVLANHLDLVPNPRFGSYLRSAYSERAYSNTVITLATLRVYQKRHGNFPPSLEIAFQEIKLPLPLDPMSARPLGYRLENGVPVWWCAGLDGRDDGGHLSYPLDLSFRSKPGYDLVARIGRYYGFR